MENLGRVIDEHLSALRNISLRMDHLSCALAVVGLDRISDELAGVSDRLPQLGADLRTAYHDDLTGQVQHAQEHTALLLKATLAGVFKAPVTAS